MWRKDIFTRIIRPSRTPSGPSRMAEVVEQRRSARGPDCGTVAADWDERQKRALAGASPIRLQRDEERAHRCDWERRLSIHRCPYRQGKARQNETLDQPFPVAPASGATVQSFFTRAVYVGSMRRYASATVRTGLTALISLGLVAPAFAEIAYGNPPKAPALTVHIKDYKYVPRSATVHVGGTVIFVNDDDETHTVTVTNGTFDSKALKEKARFSYTFMKPGRGRPDLRG